MSRRATDPPELRRCLQPSFSPNWLLPPTSDAQILKFLINQARPSDRKADPGMPSAHANSLAFLVGCSGAGGRQLPLVRQLAPSRRGSQLPRMLWHKLCLPASSPHATPRCRPSLPSPCQTGDVCFAGGGGSRGHIHPPWPGAGARRAHAWHFPGEPQGRKQQLGAAALLPPHLRFSAAACC